ncbi:tetratricopeptide repeat protein, partial [Elstera litoralis]|uniref:tetratricopeptide repeat protein n=1 Tax=Elstera litoralis TaxID=552518 RepID=UPI0012ECBF4F
MKGYFGACALLLKLQTILANQAEDKAYRAGNLTNLTIHLTRLGEVEKALTAIDESVEILRSLIRGGREGLLPTFATSLNNMSICLANLGYLDDALSAIEEAVNIERDLIR